MADLNVTALLESMGTAAAGVLKSKWPAVRSFATTEFQKITQTITSIHQQLAAGEISQDQATILLDMQKNASRAVLASLEGMTLVAAEQALNAALSAVAGVVNAFLGFPLL